MKYILQRATTYSDKETNKIEINTLDDLKKLQEKEGHEIIIDFDKKEVIVYDGYIE